MDSIIRELFHGNLDPSTRAYQQNSHLKSTMETLSQNEEILSAELEGKHKHLFLAYANAWSEINATEITELYTTGFRMGARFMLDALLLNDNEFNPIKED